MKITDINTVIGKKDVHGNMTTPESLIAMMDSYGIERAVAYHALSEFDHEKGNALMASIALESEGRIGFCAVIDSALGKNSLSGVGTLAERLAASGAECIRVFPKELRVPFDEFYWQKVLEVANKLSMPVIIDEPFEPHKLPHTFTVLPSLAEKYQRVKFVVLGLGICESRVIFPLIEKRKNVYFTIEKMLDYMQIEEICERGGDKQLLLGSAYPNATPAGALGLAHYANVSNGVKEKILSKNWEEIRYVNS